MAHDLPALWQNVLDRVNADTGTNGLRNATTPLITGIYNLYAPTAADGTTAFPYIVYHVEQTQNVSELPTRGYQHTIAFEVAVEQRPNASTPEGAQRGSDILWRLLGDWEDQSTHLPSFGFDRYSPGTLGSSGWAGVMYEFIDVQEDHLEGVYHWTARFGIRTSKRGA